MALYSRTPVNPVQSAYLRLLAEDQSAAAKAVTLYREFYDGDQGSMLTQRLAEFLNVSSGTSFAVNLMGLVVDSLAERLVLTGFSSGNDDVDDLLDDWWQANRMDGSQMHVHQAAGRDGQAFVIVEWDGDLGRPAFHENEAWDGDEGVKVHWAGRPDSRVLFASKRWREEFDESGEIVIRRRLNLYFPDRVEKYLALGGDAGIGEAGWVKYGSPWPTPWTHPRTGEPLGVPVIPFLNRQTGRSELADVIGVQTALNKTVLDILAAADVEGFGIYTKTGGAFVQSPLVAPGAFWQDTDPAASFGKIGAGTLTALMEAYWLFCKTVAIVTRRPLSLFVGYSSGESGESLKEREAGLVAQAKAATVQFGNAWENVAYMALRLHDAFGGGYDSMANLTLSAQWRSVEARDDNQYRAQLRADFQAGLIDKEQAWKEMGVSEEDQLAMLRRGQARQAALVADALRLMQETKEVNSGGQQ
jgi:hypothetical protein